MRARIPIIPLSTVNSIIGDLVESITTNTIKKQAWSWNVIVRKRFREEITMKEWGMFWALTTSSPTPGLNCPSRTQLGHSDTQVPELAPTNRVRRRWNPPYYAEMLDRLLTALALHKQTSLLGGVCKRSRCWMRSNHTNRLMHFLSKSRGPIWRKHQKKI